MVYTPLAVTAKTVLLYMLVRILNVLYLRFAGFSYRLSLVDSIVIGTGCLAAALCWELSGRDEKRQADTGDWEQLTGSGDGTDR